MRLIARASFAFPLVSLCDLKNKLKKDRHKFFNISRKFRFVSSYEEKSFTTHSNVTLPTPLVMHCKLILLLINVCLHIIMLILIEFSYNFFSYFLQIIRLILRTIRRLNVMKRRKKY